MAVCGVLDCANLATFKNLGRSLRLSRGQPLFHEGDPATRVFTVTSGHLKLYKVLADGRRHITGVVQPGDFLGMAVDDEHAFCAEALDDAELCSFPRSRFDGFVEDHAAVEHELYRKAANELAAAQQQLVLLGRKTASERVASLLLMLARQIEKASGEDANIVTLPMSRSDVADYLGITKETVSRVLSAFRSERLIRLQTLDTIEILDRAELERLGDCES